MNEREIIAISILTVLVFIGFVVWLYYTIFQFAGSL